MDNEFKPAGGVSIDNALRYVEAIEQAVRREINKVPKDERSMVLSMIAGSLRLSSDAIAVLRKRLEDTGESYPMTEEQKLQLRLILLEAQRHANPKC